MLRQNFGCNIFIISYTYENGREIARLGRARNSWDCDESQQSLSQPKGELCSGNCGSVLYCSLLNGPSLYTPTSLSHKERVTLGRAWPRARCLSVAEADLEGAINQRPSAEHSLSHQGSKYFTEGGSGQRSFCLLLWVWHRVPNSPSWRTLKFLLAPKRQTLSIEGSGWRSCWIDLQTNRASSPLVNGIWGSISSSHWTCETRKILRPA